MFILTHAVSEMFFSNFATQMTLLGYHTAIKIYGVIFCRILVSFHHSERFCDEVLKSKNIFFQSKFNLQSLTYVRSNFDDLLN